MTRDMCNRCGADRCAELFDELMRREYSGPAWGAVHLLTVDAYALQHGDHSPNSNPWHLLRLCALIEHGSDPRIGSGGPQGLASAVEGRRKLPELDPPEDRGAMTVADVHGASDAEEHASRVRRWAECVWQAWAAHHEWAREWLKRR